MNYFIDQPQLLSQFETTRALSTSICRPLAAEDHVPQPITDVSPPKWHLAHTTWFFEQFVLRRFAEDYREFHPDYGYLFNSYYNEMGERTLRPDRGFMSRPTVAEIHEYRRYIDAAMQGFLQKDLPREILEVVEIGIHHEQQHQELLVYDLKYILGNQPTFPVYGNAFTPQAENRTSAWIGIDGGLYTIGADGRSFCYDNELESHQVNLEPFEIRNTLVTNEEYLAFMQDEGYDRHLLWHAEGWDFIRRHNLHSPLYWHLIDGHWHSYTLSGLQPVDRAAPIQHLSFYEAFAFAEWAGYRLPTEFEWEIAADRLSWGQLWEWTQSAYVPYPRFSKAPGALGEYNGKFMLNQNVLRGASMATPARHSRKTYRNFFHASARWVFNGLRLAKNPNLHAS